MLVSPQNSFTMLIKLISTGVSVNLGLLVLRKTDRLVIAAQQTIQKASNYNPFIISHDFVSQECGHLPWYLRVFSAFSLQSLLRHMVSLAES